MGALLFDTFVASSRFKYFYFLCFHAQSPRPGIYSGVVGYSIIF